MRTEKFVNFQSVPEDYTGIALIMASGEQDHNAIAYYLDGWLHREDGPAVDYGDGSYAWFRLGKRHREDGPARVIFNVKEWYLDGQEYSPEEVFERMTDEQKEKAIWEINEWKRTTGLNK